MDVSVVIPLYNKARYIRRALESVLMQSHVAKEIIVVDDGSTDGSGDVARGLLTDSIKLVRQDNAGESAARNRGIMEATSDWVAFLDADDAWQPQFLARCIEAAARWPEAVAIFTNVRRDTSPAPLIASKTDQSAPVFLDNYFHFALRNRGQGMTSSSVMIRREVLLKIGGFPVGVVRGGDLDTWSRVAWAGPVVFVPEVLAIYYDNPDSITATVTISTPRTDPWHRKTWPPDAEISPSLQENARTLFQLQMRGHVRSLIEQGKRSEAWRALLTLCQPFPFPGDYVKLLAKIVLPKQATYMVRRLRAVRRIRQIW